MKYIKLFENFDSYDPYELMIMFPNKKAEMIMKELHKSKPNLSIVNDLIDFGANLDWQDGDNDGFTLLHVAVYTVRVDIVRMLIDAGADLNVKNVDGRTPLHVAAINGNEKIAQMLIDAGADQTILDNDGLRWDQLIDDEEYDNYDDEE